MANCQSESFRVSLSAEHVARLSSSTTFLSLRRFSATDTRRIQGGADYEVGVRKFGETRRTKGRARERAAERRRFTGCAETFD